MGMLLRSVKDYVDLLNRVGPESRSAFRQKKLNVQVFRPGFRSKRRLNAASKHFFVNRKQGGDAEGAAPLFLICDDVLRPERSGGVQI